MNYHAHIYFSSEEAASAQDLSKRIQETFQSSVHVHGFFNRLVGPHPLPMFELNFEQSILPALTKWLKENCQFSCLIHTDTGDDYQDHTQGALWIGKPLQLNFNFFDQIKVDASLRVHKD